MEKKLTIAHIAPYLPYGLKVLHNDWKCQLTMDANGAHNFTFSIEDVLRYARPILRPLSKLTHVEAEEIIKDAWGWKDVVSFHGINSVSVCIKGKDYDPSKLASDFHDDYDLQYIEEQEESCGADAIVTIEVPFKSSDVISYGWQDEFMYSVDIKHHVRFIQELYKRHFDLHGLLKSGLAIEKGAEG